MNEVHDWGPSDALSGGELTSLVRSNTVWTTLMVDKAFSKSLDGGLSRTINIVKMAIQTKAIYRLNAILT